MRLMFAAVPVVTLTLAAIVAIRIEDRPAAATFHTPVVNQVCEEPALQLAQAAPETVRNWAGIIAALPFEHRLVRDGMTDWLELQGALVNESETVRPMLLERYAQEANPTYRGLLAVLLSTDPTTHSRLLEDWQSHFGEPWVLFRSLAVVALTKVQPATIEEIRNSAAVEYWIALFRVAETEELEETWRREERENPELGYRKMMSCSANMMHLSRKSRLTWQALAILSPAVRSALMAGYDGEEQWAQWCIENAVANTAAKEPEFAESIVRDYLDSGLRDRALTGFEFLGTPGLLRDSAALSPRALQSIEAWALKSVADDDVFEEAVNLLGYQRRPGTEDILLNLYAHTEGRKDARFQVLDAMENHGCASFKSVAEAHLQAAEPVERVRALRIFGKSGGADRVPQVLYSLESDPSPFVRHSALALLRDRNKWSPAEERALKAAASDGDRRVRHFAEQLIKAEVRSKVPFSVADYEWSISDPGEDTDEP